MSKLIYPKQRISLAEKLSVEEGETTPKWIKDNAEYFSNRADDYRGVSTEYDDLFRWADGEIDINDYKYIENPFNTEDKRYTKYPAKIRNYDIIKPILKRRLGEREEAPINHILVGSNDNSLNEIKLAVNQVINNKITNNITSLLEGNNPEEIDIPAIESSVLINYNQKITKSARVVLERIKRSQNLVAKFQKLYYNYLVAGFPVTYKDVNHDDVLYEILHPGDVIGINWDSTSPYLEDCGAQVAYRNFSANTIIDRWREYLSDDQIDYLDKTGNEAGLGANNPFHPGLSHGVDRTKGSSYSYKGNHYNIPYDGTMCVEHIVWKSLEKRGIVKYQSDFGIREIEVDENYVLEPEKGDISIRWKWENVWWEVWRLKDKYLVRAEDNDKTLKEAERIQYLYWGQGEVQRSEVNNTSICKLPYNGFKRGYSPNHIVESLVKDGLNYQILYNILHYRFELSLARNKDKLLLFPLGLVPKVKGWNVDRWMHSVHAFSIAFFNEQDSRAMAAAQAMKQIDMSLGNYMKEMYEIMQMIKQEWWEDAGYNRQRFGEASASDLKGVTENAMLASARSTKNDIAEFERFIEKDLNGIIDYAKYAFSEGKQGIIVNGFNEVEVMDINPLQFQNTEFNVFMVSSFEENENLNLIKQTILQPLTQNGLHTGPVTEIIASKSTEKIKEIGAKADAAQRKFEESLKQMELDSNERVAEMQKEKAEIDYKKAIDVQLLRNEGQIESALITSDSFNAGLGDVDNDGVDQSQEIVDRHEDRMLKRQQTNNQQRQQESNERIANRKLELDEKKMESQERIARINKNRFDKQK